MRARSFSDASHPSFRPYRRRRHRGGPGRFSATFFAGKGGRPCDKLSVPGGKSWTRDLHGNLVARHR
ncbi:hypothetical protein ACIGW4_05245 [Streptomyces sp. NPDC053513]|uniref:Uncharacterized protein n=1 Tax=Streptomyces litmocidini TaxID=67318 RepID=A0ABW7U4K2_9ACTN